MCPSHLKALLPIFLCTSLFLLSTNPVSLTPFRCNSMNTAHAPHSSHPPLSSKYSSRSTRCGRKHARAQRSFPSSSVSPLSSPSSQTPKSPLHSRSSQTNFSLGSLAERTRAHIAHGVVMSIAMVLFFPLGGILLRLLQSQNSKRWRAKAVRVHIFCQLTGMVVMLTGFALGCWLSYLHHEVGPTSLLFEAAFCF